MYADSNDEISAS